MEDGGRWWKVVEEWWKMVEDGVRWWKMVEGGGKLFKLFLMVEYMFSFEKLEVWQLARNLSKEIYQHTSSFPNDEKFLLVSQLRRAAVSVASNIAEGTTRISPKDKAHFTTIAYSSLMEVLNQLIIAEDLGYLSHDIVSRMRTLIQTLSIKLSNLKASQLRKTAK